MSSVVLINSHIGKFPQKKKLKRTTPSISPLRIYAYNKTMVKIVVKNWGLRKVIKLYKKGYKNKI